MAEHATPEALLTALLQGLLVTRHLVGFMDYVSIHCSKPTALSSKESWQSLSECSRKRKICKQVNSFMFFI